MLYVIKKKLSHICYTLIKEVGKYLDVLERELLREDSGTPLRTLAWKIPCTEEPDRLQSMGSLGVGHD